MSPFRGFLVLVPLALAPAAAQAPAPGYRLFSPMGSRLTSLVDGDGTVVHTWTSEYQTALAVDLAADGSLLRTILINARATEASGLERVGFDGTVQWRITGTRPDLLGHHDIEPLPNGNVLRIAEGRVSRQQAIAAGRDPALIVGEELVFDRIIEIRPDGTGDGEVVWEWSVWDHLVQDFDPARANHGEVGGHPELVDVNYPRAATTSPDWNHANGIDYDPIRDWIVISMRTQNEIWIIDHGTTTAEAAGHSGGRRGKGGDLLYRWGNPAAYRAGTEADQRLFGQHAPTFVPPGYPGAGHLVVFNNDYTASQSAVDEIRLPLDGNDRFVLGNGGRFGPSKALWRYTAADFKSAFISSAARLPNGNTLVCSGGQGWVFEVTAEGQRVWEQRVGGAQYVFHAHHVPRTLWADGATLSRSGGGAVRLDLLAESRYSGHGYLLLASAAGTAPGIDLGAVVLPLNPDWLFAGALAFPNSAVFVDTLGTFDGAGGTAAWFRVPAGVLPPSMDGTALHFAYAVIDPATGSVPRVSDAVRIAIVP